MFVADGRIIQSVKGRKEFKWLMQGVLFQDDFLLLPIRSYDVVLGIQWLCKLGEMVNFENLFMHFLYRGKSITLQGTHKSFKTVDAKALNNISVDTAQIFMIKVFLESLQHTDNSQAQEKIPVAV